MASVRHPSAANLSTADWRQSGLSWHREPWLFAWYIFRIQGGSEGQPVPRSSHSLFLLSSQSLGLGSKTWSIGSSLSFFLGISPRIIFFAGRSLSSWCARSHRAPASRVHSPEEFWPPGFILCFSYPPLLRRILWGASWPCSVKLTGCPSRAEDTLPRRRRIRLSALAGDHPAAGQTLLRAATTRQRR